MELACRKVLRYTQGMNRAAFEVDERTRDAVLRNLEIIGEAAKSLPQEARELAPHIQWRRIAGFRDVIAHGYFAIHDSVLWDVVENGVPELLAAIEAADVARDDRS